MTESLHVRGETGIAARTDNEKRLVDTSPGIPLAKEAW